jgi:hypothetical protein
MKKYLVCLILACATSLALAADTPAKSQFGVFGSIHNTSYLIGVSFQLSDALKLKPSLGFKYVSDPDSAATYEKTDFNIMTRVDLLINLKIASSLSLGLGPRLGFDIDDTSYKYATVTDKYSSTNFMVGGLAEVQYLFSKNFGAFLDGALTLSFSTTKYDPGVGTGSSYTITSFDTSTAIGLAFYF